VTGPNASGSVERVRAALDAAGLDVRFERFDAGTRTVRDAAAAIGVTEGQIVKSMVFVTADAKPVLVLASGTNRVDEDLVGRHLGRPISRADAAQVRAMTGFAIGGVPPIGHATAATTLLDTDLWQYDEVWAAAGTPRDVFATTAAELQRATGGTRTTIAGPA
jgi:prolyl-tRNA editing enzyme YbaK/EbsC (Cys-tRNA(Pro) deacylase)